MQNSNDVPWADVVATLTRRAQRRIRPNVLALTVPLQLTADGE